MAGSFCRKALILGMLYLGGCKAFLSTPSHMLARNMARVGARNARPLALRMSDGEFSDWKATTAFLFPGQGAQYVGMAGQLVQDVPKAKELFDRASEVLGYDLLKVCMEGPKEKLDSTVCSQPAIYVASLAAVEKLRKEQGDDVINKATVAAGNFASVFSAFCSPAFLIF
jgi:[acyl-carrier-protein] S-malonyltransferase